MSMLACRGPNGMAAARSERTPSPNAPVITVSRAAIPSTHFRPAALAGMGGRGFSIDSGDGRTLAGPAYGMGLPAVSAAACAAAQPQPPAPSSVISAVKRSAAGYIARKSARMALSWRSARSPLITRRGRRGPRVLRLSLSAAAAGDDKSWALDRARRLPVLCAAMSPPAAEASSAASAAAAAAPRGAWRRRRGIAT
jgi:hypothetical protein